MKIKVLGFVTKGKKYSKHRSQCIFSDSRYRAITKDITIVDCTLQKIPRRLNTRSSKAHWSGRNFRKQK